MEGYGKFEDLEVWKRSARLCVEIYKVFMHSKNFGFKDQITRSALSIPSNIAEGYERESDKEIANFINYAKGSAGELRTQIYIGLYIGYIEKQVGKNLDNRSYRNFKNAIRIHPIRSKPQITSPLFNLFPSPFYFPTLSFILYPLTSNLKPDFNHERHENEIV